MSANDAMSTELTTPTHRARKDIQALRALAVALVVAYHAGIPGTGGGYVGVDVFFVISGFVITTLLLREVRSGARISLLAFYGRRARRILPASTTALVATVAAVHVVLGPVQAARVSVDALWASLFGANLHFAALGTDYLGSQLPPSALLHYWSLSVEEQFYVIWPVLMLVIVAVAGRRWRPALGLTLAGTIAGSLVASIVWTAQSSTTAYFSCVTRGWEMAVGALIAVGTPLLSGFGRVTAAALSAAGLAAIGVATFTFDASTAFPGFAALVPVLGCAAVIAAGCSGHDLHALPPLRAPIVQHLGDISFSLYLWHWPLLIIATERIGHEPSALVRILLVVVAVALAEASYRVVETPARRWSRLSTRPGLSISFGAALVTSAVVLVSGLPGVPLLAPATAARAGTATAAAGADDQVAAEVISGAKLTAAPTRLMPALMAAPTDYSDVGARGCVADFPVSVPLSPRRCTYGDHASARVTVLFGDSHAGMWLPALDSAARAAHQRLIVLAKSACPAARITMWNPQLGRTYRECDQWRRLAIAQVRTLRPDLVIVTANGSGVAWSDHGRRTTRGLDAYWQRGLTATLHDLAASGRRLVVLGDIPAQQEDPPSCLALPGRDARSCGTSRRQAVSTSHNAMEQRVAAATGARYVSVTGWFCTGTTCPALVGPDRTQTTYVVYYNQWHITASYARHLSLLLCRRLGWYPLGP